METEGTKSGRFVNVINESTTKRVWITNYAGHNYERAKSFGELRFVTKGSINFQSLDRLKFQVAQDLMEIQEDDFVLLSGTNIISVITCLLVYEKFGRINILNYDKYTDTYRVLVVDSTSNKDIIRVIMGEKSL